MRRTLLIVAFAFLAAAPAAAQQVKLTFHDGLVSLDATAVPIRQILNEWSKLGGTKVVGAERVTGAPLTLKLIEVPEAQALEIILRSVAGYMAAPRHAGTGASRYDRILVMATSAAPAPSSAAGGAAPRQVQPNPAFNGTQRFVPPQRQQQQADEEDDEEDPNPPNPPVFTFPQQPGSVQPGVFNQPQNFNGQPMIVNPPMQQQGGAAPPISYPTQGVTVPFGSSTPGSINAPPQPPGQVRPPGGQRQ